MSLDPENCSRCGVSWVGNRVPDRLSESEEPKYFAQNVVLIVDDDDDGHERPQYYQCTVCDEKTPLNIWNRGYKTEFLAAVFMGELEGQRNGI